MASTTTIRRRTRLGGTLVAAVVPGTDPALAQAAPLAAAAPLVAGAVLLRARSMRGRR
ncbi:MULTISPECIES: hypothetical protein [unclassified Leucobacter]|uniref:hypothetical protein n=1 Tax=unclassified Leucobacter TaxID=2621730 RepID=UPI00165E552A|nr:MULTISPECIES: hypothetical protein [unclassified Leucobacter]MBC9928581.1 hypothetical protein [Leucobacter sp. cx-169]